MVSNVSNNGIGPVKTIELLDSRTKKVRKFTNTTEAVDKYLKDAREAEQEMYGDATYGSLAIGTSGFFGRLLYDGIKKNKFKFGKAALLGVFMGIVSFGVIAAMDYKRKISKLADNFMKDSDKRFMQKDFDGVKFTDYVNEKAKEKEQEEEIEEEKAAEPVVSTDAAKAEEKIETPSTPLKEKQPEEQKG